VYWYVSAQGTAEKAEDVTKNARTGVGNQRNQNIVHFGFFSFFVIKIKNKVPLLMESIRTLRQLNHKKLTQSKGIEKNKGVEKNIFSSTKMIKGEKSGAESGRSHTLGEIIKEI
jgi:hypothetical protein